MIQLSFLNINRDNMLIVIWTNFSLGFGVFLLFYFRRGYKNKKTPKKFSIYMFPFLRINLQQRC